MRYLWEFTFATKPWFGRCSGSCCRKFECSGELVARCVDIGGDDYFYCVPCIEEIVRDELRCQALLIKEAAMTVTNSDRGHQRAG